MLWARLGLPRAFKHSVQSLMNRPWLSDVVQTVSALCKQLVHADVSYFEVAKQVLQDDKCGSMCELQARRCMSSTSGANATLLYVDGLLKLVYDIQWCDQDGCYKSKHMQLDLSLHNLHVVIQQLCLNIIRTSRQKCYIYVESIAKLMF